MTKVGMFDFVEHGCGDALSGSPDGSPRELAVDINFCKGQNRCETSAPSRVHHGNETDFAGKFSPGGMDFRQTLFDAVTDVETVEFVAVQTGTDADCGCAAPVVTVSAGKCGCELSGEQFQAFADGHGQFEKRACDGFHFLFPSTSR